jgi:hypothetical protein
MRVHGLEIALKQRSLYWSPSRGFTLQKAAYGQTVPVCDHLIWLKWRKWRCSHLPRRWSQRVLCSFAFPCGSVTHGGSLGSKYCFAFKSSILWDTMMCSPLKSNRRFGGICRLQLQGARISQERNNHEAGSKQLSFMLDYCLAYSSILKMEVTRSTETSIDFQRTTQGYIRENGTPHSHRCENLKSKVNMNTCFCECIEFQIGVP